MKSGLATTDKCSFGEPQRTCTGYVVAADRELAQAVCSAFLSVACGSAASALVLMDVN